jgi:hypothetical protein
MAVDLDDPKMDGYTPIQTIIDEDDDHSSYRIRDIPSGRRRLSLSIHPTEVNFGAQTVDTVAPGRVILIRNDGYATITINAIVGVGNFTVVDNEISELDPNEVAEVTVTFDPKFAGAATGGVFFDTGPDAGGEHFIKLLGTGV